MAERQQRRRSSKAAGLAPKRGKAKSLPRPAAPQRSPSSTAKAKRQTPAEASLRALLASLAALVAAHGRRAHGADGMALWLALRALVALVEQHLAAPTSTRLVQHTAGPVVGLSLEQEPPAEPPAKALPPAPAPVTLERLRARASIDADLAIKELAMNARELELLASHSPHAAALASGLRALLASPATPPQIGPAHRSLASAAADAWEELSDAERGLARAEIDIRWLEPGDHMGLRKDLSDNLDVIRSALEALGRHLSEISAELTGTETNAGAVRHAIALAALLQGTMAAEDRSVIERAARQQAITIFTRTE